MKIILIGACKSRKTFSAWTHAQNPDFTRLVTWSNEANFKLNGHVNRHAVYWSSTNPHGNMAVAQQDP